MQALSKRDLGAARKPAALSLILSATNLHSPGRKSKRVHETCRGCLFYKSAPTLIVRCWVRLPVGEKPWSLERVVEMTAAYCRHKEGAK